MAYFLTSTNSSVTSTTMSNNVVIGPNNEDDHQSRLEECKAFFQQHLTNTITSSSSSSHQELITSIQCFLFDRWSVIRFQCYKSLVKLVPSLAMETRKSLLHLLQQDFRERNRPWQELHGCLLGYDAVISEVYADEDLMHCLILDGLEVIGHIRNPIRDAAKDCIVKIGSYPIYRQPIVSQILELIRQLAITSSSNGMENEGNTLKIDGLLNVIVDLVPTMKEEITASSSSSSSTTIPTQQDSKTFYSLESLSLTMKQCFFHPASTVRQKAGNIITSMLKLLLTPSSPAMNPQITEIQFTSLIEHVLIDSLSQSMIDQWQGQEVCLMVCEELLRDVTNQYFQILLSDANQDTADYREAWLKKMDILHRLMLVLQDLVHSFLAHPRFEVRRVILQLLPTIARAKIILPPASSSNTTEDSNASNNKIHTSFEVMLDMVWLSIYMKESRHLHEVLHPSPSQSTATTSTLPSPSMFGAEYWSNEVHGRLLEVELRQDFHKQIEQVLNKANHSTSITSIRSSLVRSSQDILQLLDLYLQQLASIASITTMPKYVSIDFIEFFALSKSFLFTLHHRSNLITLFHESQTTMLAQVQQLEAKIEQYSMAWYTTLSFLQLNSGLQTAASTGSQKSANHHHHVFSFANHHSIKSTTSEFMIMFLYKYRNENKSWLNLKCQLGEFELEQVRLLPTLTDPATNPLIYTDDHVAMGDFLHGVGGGENIAQGGSSSTISNTMASPQRSSLRIQVSSASRDNSFHQYSLTPSSSTKDNYAMNALLSPGVSAKSPNITSPNRVGVGCNVPVNSSMASYHSMNRWNCEAISPLLYVLSCQLYLHNHVEDNLLLACITAEWLMNILLDPLWLDNRKFARRVLMESLPILLTMACQSLDVERPVEYETYQVMLLYLCRTMAAIFGIESKQMVMDIRLLGPFLKATLLAVNICSKLSPSLIQRVHQEVYDYCDRMPHQNEYLLVPTIESLMFATEVLLEKHTMSASYGGSSGNSSTVSKPGSHGGTPVKTSLFNQFEHAAAPLSTNSEEPTISPLPDSNEAEESDEFSDWDEDEEEENMNTADSCNSAGLLMNTINLVKDMEDLYHACVEWKEALEQTYSIEF